ncbi:MAG TPA: hypothetical protein VFW93_02235 [Aquabacterium sp.]|uniref:hypothetical protein n=1 Tax=Aquabacterium sp. TaxID=1872578 RepID=UPI002E2ED624|nr:hypothetical protein [Aquabacterium sp.]HEX5355008.1 hypothetical protein [Aquabacterium sp.]
MKTLAKRASLLLLSLVLVVLALWVHEIWAGDRSEPALSRAEQLRSYERARGWLLSHEQEVLADGNVALWWMLKVAAERSHDEALGNLVQRYLTLLALGDTAQSPWRRLVDPSVSFKPFDSFPDGMEPYQYFYYHAATCQAVPAGDDHPDTGAYLEGNACRPMVSKVWLGDRVCSSHQLMGLKLFQQSGCKTAHELKPIEDSLLEDIREQIWLAPLYQDAYIQRVLMIKWFAPDHQIKPVWLRRIIQAQGEDGGWTGARLLPYWPRWAQPWVFKYVQLKLMGKDADAAIPVSNFHATAQGLLLLALNLNEAP